MPDYSGTDKTSHRRGAAFNSQRPTLVSIFEMVPPVQRMQNNSPFFYSDHFTPSIQFRIPWTGGNPKRFAVNHAGSGEFRIPWTGGNPKRQVNAGGRIDQFRIPWTGGNPKLRG